ncbi:MAG TPA: histidine phosphatase family protein [Actinomycetes bacterium]|nr:histidine phosphatase family protein [Actinomycetes bacterium]
MRTLVLLRHGKSAYPDGVDDHERPLNDRGRAQAALAGQRLRASLASMGNTDATVDLALVSAATRAQQTWERVEPGLRVGRLLITPDLYLADVEALTGLVAGSDASVDTAVFVGHNEGLEDFATFLSGEQVTLKTSSYAVLTSDAPWAAWTQQSADLNEVVIAR